MKKQIILFLLILWSPILFAVCNHEDENKLIKDRFYEYANKNFDNPSLIKEIAYIDKDTVYGDNIIYEFNKLLLIIDSLRYDNDMLSKKLIELKNNNKKANHIKNKIGTDAHKKLTLKFMEFHSFLDEYITVIKNHNDFYEKSKKIIKDTVEHEKDFVYAKIHFRIKENNDLKLEVFFYIEDIKNKNYYKISEKEFRINIFGNKMDAIQEYTPHIITLMNIEVEKYKYLQDIIYSIDNFDYL